MSSHRLVALVGNPNAGKTTLFNALTGSTQKVGNYPGVTVEKVTGLLHLQSGLVDCVDVPGLYSLRPVSEDEHVAAAVIEGVQEGRLPDLLVVVIDGTNLERNLYLYSQIVETRLPTLVVLTMTDRLKASGKQVDLQRLSSFLDSDVVAVIGHKDEGLDELRREIDRNLASPRIPNPDHLPSETTESLEALRERLARQGLDYNTSELRKLLKTNPQLMRTYAEDFPELGELIRLASERVQIETEPTSHEVAARYTWSGMVERECVSQEPGFSRISLTDKIDRILTHRVFGLIVFGAVMYLVFQSIYTFANPLMNGIEWVFDRCKDFLGPKLAGTPWLQSLVLDGLIAGVGGVLKFLPQILILFFFIAILEGTGYLARAAFLMDRLLGWCGLNGRAFIPLLSSYACAIPGIMAARVMPDQKSRLATIMVAPLMSCSARLPVYLLLISAFIQPKFGPGWAGFTLFAMHLLGLFVAIPVVFFFNRKILKGKRLPFVLELPPYQWPKWRDVWISMFTRGRIFVKTAGTVIVFMSIAIWALVYFPQYTPAQVREKSSTYVASHPEATANEISNHLDEEQRAQSYLGRFGRAIEPAFLPAGFDWRITTSILAAFPARETVVPSLGILFAQGKDVTDPSKDLADAMSQAKWPDGKPLFTPWTAVGLMVFFALCAQCFSTLATVRRETNTWKWPIVMFVYMTTLAYVGAVFVNFLSHFFGN